MQEKIEAKLKLIYQDAYKKEYLIKMQTMLKQYQPQKSIKRLSHESVYLITYGDIIQNSTENSLSILHKFVKSKFGKNISDIHLLPMFEYTSDDGFSVIDYLKINHKLGTWNNIAELSKDYNLMFDFVANHISKSSEWFKEYLNNNPNYQNYFIPFNHEFNYENVVRPRTSKLISKYPNGKTAWTTFSEDQVDLNYQNIDVLVETTRILLEYVQRGATSIRLDAIGFLWKKSGTTCIHLNETHEIVKLWRIILDYYAENLQIITETNVPHKENISYFGANDEAHQVYQFALPPLTLHTFIEENSKKLSEWAKTINKVSNDATYFNFLASHDGIGMRPVEEILTENEKQTIFNQVKGNGGKFNYKSNSDGSKTVYELNITYFDALADPNVEDDENIKRFIAAHGILMSLIGVPAIYYNSLIGSRNDYEGVRKSGINRRINRQKFLETEIENEIQNSYIRKNVIAEMNHLLKVRKSEKLFNPYNQQEVLDLGISLFGVKRIGENNQEIICIINITNRVQRSKLTGLDILTNQRFEGIISPYQIVWLKE